jgi:hypothetical protein
VGTACGRPIDTDCTDPDTCDGAGTCLPNDEPVGTVCGSPDDTDCTDPDTCDDAGSCLPNDEPGGTACGDPADTECTDPDTCDDAGTCLPNNEPVGTACGDPADTDCTNPDTCDDAGTCGANHEADGTACTDCALVTVCSTCLDGLCPDAAQLVGNGTFADGLVGWTTANNPVGATDPTSTFYVTPPAERVQNEPSFGPRATVLLQEFTVPATVSAARFSLDFAQDGLMMPLDPENVPVIQADGYDASGNGLPENAFRIDIIAPGPDPFLTPILFELYTPVDPVGVIGGALVEIVVDDQALLAFLQANAGAPLVLRIAQVESTFPWTVQFDNVTLLIGE